MTSLACLAAARASNVLPAGPPAFVAGHSLGEYTALVAAESLEIDAGVRLVQKRGRLMQAAGEANPGTLAAVLGLPEAEVRAVCRETGTEICNVNAATQIVVGGTRPAVARAMDLARARGARKTIALRVSAAFHSSLMRPAADRMLGELERVTFRLPLAPLVANVTGRAIDSTLPGSAPLGLNTALRRELAEQLQQTVRWQQSVQFMVEAGVTTFAEIGPGTVLTGAGEDDRPQAAAHGPHAEQRRGHAGRRLAAGVGRGNVATLYRRARVLAFQALFEAEFGRIEAADALARGLQGRSLPAKERAYAEALLRGVGKEQPALDAEIAAAAPAWPVAQLGRVERVVLRVALYELLFNNAAVPAGAAINEAVELAKTYGSDASRRFVNGVLGTVSRARVTSPVGQQAETEDSGGAV